MYLEGDCFFFPTRGGRLSEGALHGRRSALCTLSGALEYWLAEARVDATAKVTVWGLGKEC